MILDYSDEDSYVLYSWANGDEYYGEVQTRRPYSAYIAKKTPMNPVTENLPLNCGKRQQKRL